MVHLKAADEGCTGCLVCSLICSLQHTGEFNLRRSAIKISSAGMFPGKVQVCHQCAKAACVEACPVNALTKSDRFIELNREICTGCGACVDACPFDAIHLDPIDGLVRKCDMCNGSPSCISYCSKQVLSILEGEKNI